MFLGPLVASRHIGPVFSLVAAANMLVAHRNIYIKYNILKTKGIKKLIIFQNELRRPFRRIQRPAQRSS